MNVDYYKPYIDCGNMKEIIKSKGLKISWLAEKIGVTQSVLHQVLKGERLPGTKLLSIIASQCRCPISSIIKFNDIEYSSDLTEKDFVPPVFSEDKISYEPLKRLVSSIPYYKNLDALFNILPNNIMKSDNKVYKHFVPSKNGGLGDRLRLRIFRDENVSVCVIYEICKALHCNIDFVMEWK